ncbi:hypothetical protein IscW_ISCW003388 [Ixodes scapularis]|uniref:Uncharacterized protein n=1 Tax=Ixodes scapularis TaxID=6945 RepID=B7P957_IXOSC|nr:hypothetical protein IscW_ISCW003388 [Ixodes scapularis]|eukprot:XP_002403619.1 hypothetical protein IscW_ISCW003388 [Ixodes scapularis]
MRGTSPDPRRRIYALRLSYPRRPCTLRAAHPSKARRASRLAGCAGPASWSRGAKNGNQDVRAAGTPVRMNKAVPFMVLLLRGQDVSAREGRRRDGRVAVSYDGRCGGHVSAGKRRTRRAEEPR